MNRWLPIILIWTTITGVLGAHDLYIVPQAFTVEPGSKLSVGFHNGDSFPDSQAAPVVVRLKNTQLLSPAGVVPIVGLKIAGKQVIGTVEVPASRGTMILSVETVPNLIQLEPDEFLGYLKEEGLAQVIEWRSQRGESRKPGRERYSKFAKSFVTSTRADDFYKHPIGLPIEILPDANPSTLRAGSELPVRVLFRGKPAAGLQLEAAWASGRKSKTTVVGRTNADGRIRVRIGATGKWRLHSLMMVRCPDAAVADWESFWASLTFEVR